MYTRARVHVWLYTVLTQKPSAHSKKPSPTHSTHVGGISTALVGNDSKPYPTPNEFVSNARFSFDIFGSDSLVGGLVGERWE